VGKLSLSGPLLRLRGPSRLTTNAVGFKVGGCPCAPLPPCASSTVLSLPPSLWLDKKKSGTKVGEDVKRKKEIGRNTKVLKVLPFLPS
jgi:hypothetical protein